MSSDEFPYTWTRRNFLALSSLAAASAASGAEVIQGVRAAAASEPSAPDVSAMDFMGPSKGRPIDVAVLLGTCNTLIDFAGPWEILSSSSRFNVYSVAAGRKPVICDDGRSLGERRPISGLTVVPDFTFEDAPQPRIIIVGGQAESDSSAGKAAAAQKLAWLRRASAKAELTSSVCVGAFLLADAGLLDGRSATTNRNAYDRFEMAYPKVKLVRGVRFVESGPIATATGLTAGMDLAFRIADRFCGRAIAQHLADYEEWPGKAWIV